MTVSLANDLLPSEVLSIIVVAIGDPVLCSKVCQTWARAVREDPFLYVKIFEDWMKNKNIAPLLIYLTDFVPKPTNTQAAHLVKLAYAQILAEVKEYMVSTRKKTFSAVYPFFEDIQTMKLSTFWDHWNYLSQLCHVPATHPKQLAQNPLEKAEHIRGWMKQGLNVEEIDLSARGILGLPAEFFEQMRDVKNIILCQNNLKSLPPGISQCKQLIALDLRDNLIQSLPLELGRCPNLKGVHLDRYTFETVHIPKEIAHLIQIPEREDSGIGERASEVKFQFCPIF